MLIPPITRQGDIMWLRRARQHLHGTLAKNDIHLTKRIHRTHWSRGTCYKITASALQVSQGHERRRLSCWCRLEMNKETQQLSTVCDPGLDPGSDNGPLWGSRWHLNKVRRPVNSVVTMFLFWLSWFFCGYVKVVTFIDSEWRVCRNSLTVFVALLKVRNNLKIRG